MVHQKLSLMRAQIGGHGDYETARAAAEIELMIKAHNPAIRLWRGLRSRLGSATRRATTGAQDEAPESAMPPELERLSTENRCLKEEVARWRARDVRTPKKYTL